MKSTKKTHIFETGKKLIASFFWLEPCAGGICTRERKGTTEILCVTHKDGGIMLPKGRIKSGETTEQAALREFMEETGIYNCTLGNKIGIIRDRNRGKKIVFYSVHSSGQHTPIHDEAIMWIDLSSAIKNMKHRTEKIFLKKHFSKE